MPARLLRYLIPLLLVSVLLMTARPGAALDVTTVPAATTPEATPGNRCDVVLAYHDASLGRLAAARNLIERTAGQVPELSFTGAGSAVLDLLRAQRDEVVPPGGLLAQQLTLGTLASWQLYLIDLDLSQILPSGTALADASETMTRALTLDEQATLELARIARDCGETPPEPTPVPGQGSLPARDVTPEGGAQIWSCSPDVQSVYCVTPTAPAR